MFVTSSLSSFSQKSVCYLHLPAQRIQYFHNKKTRTAFPRRACMTLPAFPSLHIQIFLHLLRSITCMFHMISYCICYEIAGTIKGAFILYIFWLYFLNHLPWSLFIEHVEYMQYSFGQSSKFLPQGRSYNLQTSIIVHPFVHPPTTYLSTFRLFVALT